MTETPVEGRGTTGQGRPIGPNRRIRRVGARIRTRPFSVRPLNLYGDNARRSISEGTNAETPDSPFPPAVPRVYAVQSDRGSGIPVSEAEGREYGVSCATEGFPKGDLGRCALARCARPADRLIEHPNRPEGCTPLCEHHAVRAAGIGGVLAR
jgi:hypothetical protein